MSSLQSFTPPDRRSSELAIRFFSTSLGCFALAGGVAGLLRVFAPLADRGAWTPVVTFAISTLLIFAGSVAMGRAMHFVRREKQRPFRRSLITAVLIAVLFVGFQSYGLGQLLPRSAAEAGPSGAYGFLFALVFLHAMHIVVAILFLVWVTLQALRDRYDHEYSWGVTACGYFWHFLGAVWAVIVFAVCLVIPLLEAEPTAAPSHRLAIERDSPPLR